MFTTSQIGVWSAPSQFTVTRERTVAYAEATNDPIAAHLAGTLAPPVFAVVPGFAVMAEQTLAVAPKEDAGKILHGQHDLYIARPIAPGDILTTRAQVIGVHTRSSGVVVTTFVETQDVTGELVNEQYFTGFFRGSEHEGNAGRTAPQAPDAETDTGAAVAMVQKIDLDQTFRYAEASGDTMPVHLDDDFARSVGLSGIIVHGLCTMAFASHALISHVAPGAPDRLRRLTVRFSAPARPGEEITTTLRQSAMGQYAFDTVNDHGAGVLTGGHAEFAN